MKRRIVIFVIALGALIGLGSGAASAGPFDSTTEGGYWACIAVYQIDLGLCVENPLPEQLPV